LWALDGPITASGNIWADDYLLADPGACRGGGLSCPRQPVTRAEVAVAFSRALDLPPSAVDFFSDDEVSYESDINAVAAAGITMGTSSTTYHPDDWVTRGQMAAFLVRAFDLPPGGTTPFADVAGTPFADAIASVYAAGITLGTSPTTYGPWGQVTRSQLAAFLSRGLG
jgi:hypothetical protein